MKDTSLVSSGPACLRWLRLWPAVCALTPARGAGEGASCAAARGERRRRVEVFFAGASGTLAVCSSAGGGASCAAARGERRRRVEVFFAGASGTLAVCSSAGGGASCAAARGERRRRVEVFFAGASGTLAVCSSAGGGASCAAARGERRRRDGLGAVAPAASSVWREVTASFVGSCVSEAPRRPLRRRGLDGLTCGVLSGWSLTLTLFRV